MKKKKKRKLWVGPSNNSVLLETLKFPLLTTVHAMNRWSDKMIAFMNQHWQGNINKTTESAYFVCPACTKYSGNPVHTPPEDFK